MIIKDFTHSHIAGATALALSSYNEERSFASILSQINVVPNLYEFARNGFGVTAFDGDKMLGFLCSYPPFDNAFRSTYVRGIFSPMGANAAIKENRTKIYAAMYQGAAAKWVHSGAVAHAVCLYAHDEELQQQFYKYGFGLRCIDGIRPMKLIECKPCEEYEFVELVQDEYVSVYQLYLMLNRHYCESPFFMNRTPDTFEGFVQNCLTENARYFVAKHNSELCGFVKISDVGETFVASGTEYCHIREAYCLPEHRGKGVHQNLLNFAITTLKAGGYTRLGVDFESVNPTAYGFWMKYFTAYTHSVVRRIDERIL